MNALAQLIAMFGMFIAGGMLGWGLSSWAAPVRGSELPADDPLKLSGIGQMSPYR